VIIPYGMPEPDWFDTTTLDLVQYGPLARYEGSWRECAVQWLQNPQIAAFDVPRPDGFDDWRQWASRFNQAIFG